MNAETALDAMLSRVGRVRRGPASAACAEAEAAFATGLRWRSAGAQLDEFCALPREVRPFAFEGAGAVDELRRLPDANESTTELERMFLHFGRGITRGALGLPLPEDPIQAEGFGFGEAMYRPERTHHSGSIARDTGIGRSLWFIHAGTLPRIRAALTCFDEARRAALWNGVARAAVFTGGGPPDRTLRILAAAGIHANAALAGDEASRLLRAGWGKLASDSINPQAPAKGPDNPTIIPGVAAVRGMGAISAAGVGVAALAQLARENGSAIRAIARFNTTAFAVHKAALVPGFDQPPLVRHLDGRAQAIALEFARIALRETLENLPSYSGITALVFGSNLEDRPAALDELAATLGLEFGVNGPCYAVNTACASGTSAIGHALELLNRGDAGRVLVGGVDVITPPVLAGFSALGAVSESAHPFSTPFGLALGEGAAFMLLEPAQSDDSTCVLGYGLAGDAFHETRPAPDGRGVQSAVRAALSHAGLSPQAIEYVNAHGTGTEANDAPEWLGIQAALQGLAPPTSSAKGMIGHAQGAAGALEVVLTLACRAQGFLPPTVGFGEARLGAPPDAVPVARAGRATTFLSCSSAFGGINAAVVVGPARPVFRPRNPVFLAGTGVWAPPPGHNTPRTPAAHDLPRWVDPTSLTTPHRWLCAAIHRALSQAGIRLDRATCARTGLVLGIRHALDTDGQALGEHLDKHGLAGVSAGTFVRALCVMPAGTAAAAFGLLGPLDVVVAGGASGGVALVHAATMLESRTNLDYLVVATIDDAGKGFGWSGAAAAVLARSGPHTVQHFVLAASSTAALMRAQAGKGAAQAALDASGPTASSALLALAQHDAGREAILHGGIAHIGYAIGLGVEG